MIINTTGLLKGKLGDVVYCQRGDVAYVRTKPLKVKQTAATKKSSSNFSIAGYKGSLLRSLLLPVLHFPKSKPMQNAFQGAIHAWLSSRGMESLSAANDITRLREFDFNEDTSIRSRWKLSIDVAQNGQEEIVVQIPAFIPATTIKAPANTVSVECAIAAASVLMSRDELVGHDHFSMIIPYDRQMVPEQSIELAVTTKPGCLVVVAASMKFHFSNGKTDTRLPFLPSSVIAAWYNE